MIILGYQGFQIIEKALNFQSQIFLRLKLSQKKNGKVSPYGNETLPTIHLF